MKSLYKYFIPLLLLLGSLSPPAQAQEVVSDTNLRPVAPGRFILFRSASGQLRLKPYVGNSIAAEAAGGSISLSTYNSDRAGILQSLSLKANLADLATLTNRVNSLSLTIGPPGPAGPVGPQGAIGPAPTLTIGQVFTLPPGSPAQATISGSAGAYQINLSVPAGAAGAAGANGTNGINGTNGAAGPAGPTGPQGAAGATGPAGPAGTTPTFSIGTVTSLAAGATPTVSISGSGTAYTLNLGIPAGANGANGTNGTNGVSPTVTIGTTTTLAAGSPATVTDSDAGPNMVLNFGIPRSAGAGGGGDTLQILTGGGQLYTYLSTKIASTTATVLIGSSATASNVADSTVNRVELTAMTSVTFTTGAQLQAFLDGGQSNKRVYIADSLSSPNQYGFEPKGNLTNVLFEGLPGCTHCGLRNIQWTQTFIFNSNLTHNKVAFRNLKIWTRYPNSNTTDPIFRTTELPTMNGLELGNVEIFSASPSPGNLVTIQHASQTSQQGKTSKDFFIHDCYFHDSQRMAWEQLSQVYDGVYRMSNLTYVRNRHEYLGKGSIYGMAGSWSGLINGALIARNSFIEAKQIGYEFVNTKRFYAEYNTGTSTINRTAAYGFSDDAQKATQDLHIVGGTFNVTERPFYGYDTPNITVDGGTYTARRGVDLKVQNSVFKNITLNIRESWNQASFSVDNTSTNNIFDNITINSSGSIALTPVPTSDAATTSMVGPAETFVLRSGATGNTVTNLNLTQGQRTGGTYFSDGGYTGGVRNLGTNNTVSNITFQRANN